MIVTVGALKGGVGKSTVAMMLACLFAETGPTVLIDADRQGTVSTWARAAVEAGDEWPIGLTVEPWNDHATLPPAGLSHVVIDTPPGDEGRLRRAVERSDVVIVPVGARGADVSQIGATADVIEGARGQWAVLLTMVEAGQLEERQAPSAIVGDDLPLLATTIPYRVAIRRAFGQVPDLTWHRQVGPFRDLFHEITRESTDVRV